MDEQIIHGHYEVYKEISSYRSLKWYFSIPTKGGIKGQLLCYTTKKVAEKLAEAWKNANGEVVA